MNKLVISNNDDISDIVITEDTCLSINFIDSNKYLHINVMDGICLKVFEFSKNTANKVIYRLGMDSNVILNKIAFNNSDIVDVFLDGERANLKFYSSILNETDNVCVQNIYHNASFTKSDIRNHGVNIKDRVFHFLVNGTVSRNSIETDLSQDNKIINLENGKSFIFPNLIVDDNCVNATHSAYIGDFKKDEIFYLQSRGISYRNCRKLLLRGFILNHMDLADDDLEMVDKLLEDI